MINAAIYGLGRWGKVLVNSVHGKSEKIRFVTGVSRSPDIHETYGREMGLSVTDSFANVLADPGIDAVILASPPWLHSEQIIAAAGAGKPVYVEKPFTLSLDEAKLAVDAARDARIVLAVGFNRRYLNAIQDMKARVRNGQIGDIVHMECQFSGATALRTPKNSWRANRADNPAGGMVARGIHVLDAMIDVLGPVETVFADSERRHAPGDIDDTTSVLLRFARGATGYLSTIMVTGEYFRIQILGNRGWIELRGPGELICSDLDGKQMVYNFEPMDIERASLEAFADAVAGGKPYAVDPQEVVQGVAALEAIEQSAKLGEAVTIRN